MLVAARNMSTMQQLAMFRFYQHCELLHVAGPLDVRVKCYK